MFTKGTPIRSQKAQDAATRSTGIMSHRDDVQVGGVAQAFDAHGGPSHDERTTIPDPPAEQTVYRAARDRARTKRPT
jgi:hypothetical protein